MSLPPMTEQEVNHRPRMRTRGEKRVKLVFNPDQSTLVGGLKQTAAAFIDLCCPQNVASHSAEQRRLWALAMTAAEEAAMWAVKAATFEPDQE